ncbi:MAG: zinc ribbon domain-containing protein [Verrucomicrobiota bacterium]
MTTYVYETIPLIPGVAPERFEVRQAMADAPLARHPTTGQPVRRVITGGYGLMGVSGREGQAQSPVASSHCCGAQCGCGAAN